MTLVAALCEQYGWPHDFWRRMGWRELRLWMRELREQREHASRGHLAAPGSWDGAEHDEFWARNRGRRRR